MITSRQLSLQIVLPFFGAVSWCMVKFQQWPSWLLWHSARLNPSRLVSVISHRAITLLRKKNIYLNSWCMLGNLPGLSRSCHNLYPCVAIVPGNILSKHVEAVVETWLMSLSQIEATVRNAQQGYFSQFCKGPPLEGLEDLSAYGNLQQRKLCEVASEDGWK